jgi:hypothetical protein
VPNPADLYLGPGELRIGLDVNRNTVLNVWRQNQEDMTVSVAENLITAELPDKLTGFLQAAKSKVMVRRYDFATLEGTLILSTNVTARTPGSLSNRTPSVSGGPNGIQRSFRRVSSIASQPPTNMLHHLL